MASDAHPLQQQQQQKRPSVLVSYHSHPARFQPIPQGPPSPSFLKPSHSGKARPSSPLLPLNSPPSSPTRLSSASSMARSTARAVLLALALLSAFMVVTQTDLGELYTGEKVGRWRPDGSLELLREQLQGLPADDVDDPHVDEREIRETTVVQHAPGWTTFDNLYQLNQTFYLVSSNASALPAVRLMISTGAEIGNSDEDVAAREPTDDDMRVITPNEARTLFARKSSITGLPIYPQRESGLSWIINEPPQFIAHYYHFAAELLFGLWRTTTAIPSEGSIHMLPRRMIYTKLSAGKWRDYSGMNALLMRAFLPQTLIETATDVHADRAASDRPYVYTRVVFADRGAAMRGAHFLRTGRTASETFMLPTKPYWFAPIRSKLLNYIGGVLPADLEPKVPSRPLVTYVSRQKWGRRMLNPADHAALVETMTKAAAEDGFDFVEIDMHRVGLEEQVRLAARTTVMMGVHGNGLTHLLWMKPTSSAAVLEFFAPGGFARDYSFTALGLGIQHYGFWGERSFVAPHQPPTAYPPAFQGNNIPISADAVLRIVRMRLNNDEEADDG